MKNILVLAVLLVGGLLAYNYAASGELTLVPSFSSTSEEREIKDLQKRLDAAKKQYSQAGRVAGLSGMDMTSDVAAVQQSVKEIQRELKALQKRISDDKAAGQAKELARDVREFAKRLR